MLARGCAFLEQKGDDEARLHAELLVAFALGLDRLHLFLELERPVDAQEVIRARELLVRRGTGEPVAYLTGSREFYGRPFRVGKGVLVPRPETELLVDCARELANQRAGLRVAELGTGSGCIAVTLALELEGASVLASDLSREALAFARENAANLGAEVTLVEGDGLSPFEQHGPFDLFLSNPPYVDPKDAALASAVRDHEPALALFSPAGNPDHWVERLLEEALPLLVPDGVLLVELGHDQGPRVRRLCERRGLPFEIRSDLSKVERVLCVNAGVA